MHLTLTPSGYGELPRPAGAGFPPISRLTWRLSVWPGVLLESLSHWDDLTVVLPASPEDQRDGRESTSVDLIGR